MPPTQNLPSAVLRDAAVYLYRHGWIQHDFYDLTTDTPTPRACVVGAIALAATGRRIDSMADDNITDPVLHEPVDALLGNLAEIDPDWEDPTLWNDLRHMTAELVIERLYKAAAAWDREHLVCSACHSPVRTEPPNRHLWGLVLTPVYTHTNRTPLCPVEGPHGYRTAQPMLRTDQ